MEEIRYELSQNRPIIKQHQSEKMNIQNLAITVTALAMTPFANAALININLTAGAADETGLTGPAGGAGETWHQISGASGAAGSTTITTNFGLTAFDTPVIDLPMLRGSMTEFGKGVDNRTVAISGLENGGTYDIWMVSFRNQGAFNGQAEQYAGWWSTSNATTSASDQFIDARGAVNNTSTFVDGYNYVLFENVEADGSGNILFTGTAGDLLDGSVNAHRFGLNGLQINQVVPEPGSLALLAFGGLLALRRRR